MGTRGGFPKVKVHNKGVQEIEAGVRTQNNMNRERQTSDPEQNQQDEMEKSLELVRDPELKRTLTRILDSIKPDIYKEAQEIRKKIINAPKKPEQTIFAFIPHEMAKVSIFFPMSDRELKEERRLIQKIEHESSWGKIVIEGVKLAIFEEDVFLAIIKIAQEKIQHIKGQFVLETPIQEIARILYGEAGYTKRAYNLIKRTLDHFELVRFELTLFKDQKKEGQMISIGGVIQRYDYDEKARKLKIYFNPHFFAYFLESMLTNINFSLRRRLKKDGSKALLRFISTHSKPDKMHILTVLNAINFDTTQPMFRLRNKTKGFISELKKHGVLGPRTKIYSNDTVYFDILPSKKALPE
jgi:hypothetical protein